MDKTAYLQEIDRVIQTGKYRDTWESLSQYRIPEWYKDTKLGIFIHWGRILRACLWKRVVSPQYVYPGFAGI